MNKLFLLALATYFACQGAMLFLAPLTFYDTVPGVSHTGPFNSHFLRDVGLALLLSAAGLGLGAVRNARVLALFGAGFPVLHGAFHLSHWAAHGMPLNGVEIFGLTATVLPAVLAALFATCMKEGTPA